MEKPLQNMVAVIETGAKKQSSIRAKKDAEQAIYAKGWDKKRAPKPEKKALDDVLKVLDKVCPASAADKITRNAKKNGFIKAADLQDAAKDAKWGRSQVKKICTPFPDEVRRVIVKDVEKSFDDALSFWKEMEAKAKKAGVMQ